MDKVGVVIIGSGPGGYGAAIGAAQRGLKTAVVEKDKELGGTCLNIGCIPSKALLTASDHFVFAKKEAAKHGIVLEKKGLELKTMLARKNKVVKTMNSGVKMLMKGNKITTFQGLGTITAPGRVTIKPGEGDSQEIEAKNIVIATGSIPVELANMKFDGDVIVSSTEALTFEKAPEKLLVIGGGAIGLELGSVWSRRGSDVGAQSGGRRDRLRRDDRRESRPRELRRHSRNHLHESRAGRRRRHGRFRERKRDEGADRQISFPGQWAGGRERRCGRRGEIRRRRRHGSDHRRAYSRARRVGVDRRNRGGDGIRRQLRGSRPRRPRAPDVKRSRERSGAECR